jgi:hypothetical protein
MLCTPRLQIELVARLARVGSTLVQTAETLERGQLCRASAVFVVIQGDLHALFKEFSYEIKTLRIVLPQSDFLLQTGTFVLQALGWSVGLRVGFANAMHYYLRGPVTCIYVRRPVT